MQPIDWQPTVDPGDDGLPGHRRMPSSGSNRSYHSGSDHDGPNMAGRGGYGYGASSDHGHGAGGLVADLPSHDFTAGPTHLAPVGGYADLARGVSPQPQMQEALTRGPSVNRGMQNQYSAYENYGPRY